MFAKLWFNDGGAKVNEDEIIVLRTKKKSACDVLLDEIEKCCKHIALIEPEERNWTNTSFAAETNFFLRVCDMLEIIEVTLGQRIRATKKVEKLRAQYLLLSPLLAPGFRIIRCAF